MSAAKPKDSIRSNQLQSVEMSGKLCIDKKLSEGCVRLEALVYSTKKKLPIAIDGAGGALSNQFDQLIKVILRSNFSLKWPVCVSECIGSADDGIS